MPLNYDLFALGDRCGVAEWIVYAGVTPQSSAHPLPAPAVLPDNAHMEQLLSFDWLYLVGTVSFSISGYLIGARKQFDLLGIIILALLTAIGGGLLRDVLVGRVPAVFTNADQRIVLSGKAEFWQGKNLIKGEEITVWLKEDRALVTSKGSDRVRAVIYEEEK